MKRLAIRSLLLAVVLLAVAIHDGVTKPAPKKVVASDSLKFTNAESMKGPSFYIKQLVDSGFINGRKVLVPGPVNYEWNDGNGKKLSWIVDTGVVVNGDSAVSLRDVNSIVQYLASVLANQGARHAHSDSVMSRGLEEMWTILNPKH